MDRRERRAVARDILKNSPGLVEKIAEEEGVTRPRAKALAVSYIASGLAAQEAFGFDWPNVPVEADFDADDPALD